MIKTISTDRTIEFSVPALRSSCSYFQLIFNQMYCHSEMLKRITDAFWLYPSFTELEVCNEQEMKLKWQHSHVHAMLQLQSDGWRFRGWKWKKMTDLILFSINVVVFRSIFSLCINPHIEYQNIGIRRCKQSCSGVRLIFGGPLISGLIALCVDKASGMAEISAGFPTDTQCMPWLCKWHANQLQFSD